MLPYVSVSPAGLWQLVPVVWEAQDDRKLYIVTVDILDSWQLPYVGCVT